VKRDAGVVALDCICFAAITIPQSDVMALREQQPCDGRTHLAEAEEGEVLNRGHWNSSMDLLFIPFDERMQRKETGCSKRAACFLHFSMVSLAGLAGC
jgi:hypothetical protein